METKSKKLQKGSLNEENIMGHNLNESDVIVKEEPIDIIEISDDDNATLQMKRSMKPAGPPRPLNTSNKGTLQLQKEKSEPKPEFKAKSGRYVRENTKMSSVYSYKYPTSPHQFKSIANAFRNKIEHLKFQLNETLNYHDPQYQTLIISKVYIKGYNEIHGHTCEFIRSELIGWIGKCQYQNRPTPIFHSMTNNQTHITIVCENTYAFECLENCIIEIGRMKNFCGIVLERLPPTVHLIYLYDVVYDGIARHPEVLLKQIKLHHQALDSERWIIVSHEVSNTKCVTHYMLLIDEPSALALTYYYKDQLFICMQRVQFNRRGCL